MIERRYRPGVAVLGGKIYVLGQYIAEYTQCAPGIFNLDQKFQR